MPAMENLFTIQNLIPHGYCLSWSPILLKLHIITDLLISLAYFSIPITLLYFLAKRKVFMARSLVGLFAAFIISCGLTHLMSLITIWYPIYWVAGLFKAITALLSVITAFLMVKIAPKVMALPLELMESQYQNIHILNNMHQGIILMDAHHKITYCNAASSQLTGYTLNELLGKSCTILQGTDSDPAQYAKIWAAMNNHEIFHGEILNYRKDGSVFWNELSMTPILNRLGVVTQFLCMQTDISERKHIESQLILSEQNFRDLTNSSPAMIWIANIDKKPAWFNASWLSFSGHDLEHELSHGWQNSMYTEDHGRCLEIFNSHFNQRLPFQIEYRMRSKEGEYRWVDCNGVPRFNSEGTFKGYICYVNDISATKYSEVANDFFNSSHEMIYSTDLQGFIVEVNDRFLQVTGYNRDELLGRHIRIIKSGLHGNEFYVDMWNAVINTGFWCGEITNRTKNGEAYSVVSTITTIKDEMQNPIRYLAIASDISTVIEKRRQIEQLAYYDSLTGLPNRLLLKDRLAQAIARVGRLGNCLAIVFIDLDGFKLINDNFGHNTGDEFLIAISQLIKQTIRESDTVVRIGGDEFIVLLTDLENEQAADTPIEHLLKTCQTPIKINNLSLSVSASIGFTIYKDLSDIERVEVDVDELISQADKAMYVAKQSGKNCAHRFDGQVDDMSNTRTDTLRNIEHGLKHDEFVLHYQPKIDLHSGELMGVEALIRWQHPTRGLLGPYAFLSLLDNHPLGIELGYWVLNSALIQIDTWRELGLNIAVSINIDARLLHQPDFLSKLQGALAVFPNHQPGYLEFEILETNALQDRAQSIKIIQACKDMGIKFSLDDFGTGFSSLTYLQQLPIDIVKIDRSFVGTLEKDSKDYLIVKNIIGLVNNIGYDTIAEGIETIEQGEILLTMGCKYGQGYYIAKPMPAADMPTWKANWQIPETWKNALEDSL